MGHTARMSVRAGVGIALVVALAGCREIAHDPAARHAAPVVLSEPDAAVHEDASPPPLDAIPPWAREDAPPPAFPPPDPRR